VTEAVLSALNAGYRHFDTASAYNTEAALGDAVIHAVRDGIVASRDDLYITSKLAVTDAHPGRVLPALHKSLRLVLIATQLIITVETCSVCVCLM
jgi:diketogulonate reductase-like aldo/keto reductase